MTDIKTPKQDLLSKPILREQPAYYLEKSSLPERKIRVLLVITVLGTGGATNVVMDLANHFNNSSDFEVLLLTGPIPSSRNDLTHVAYEQGIPIQIVPSLINHINPLENIKAVVDLRNIIVKGDFDVVHTHSSVAGVVGRFAAFTAGVPVIIHHVHGWGIHEKMSRWTRIIYLNLERFCAKFTNRLIVVSKTDKQKGLEYRICNEDKFTLIYNGIDLERFQQDADDRTVRTELGLKPDSKLVGMTGRLDEQKNPLDFIKAAAMVSKGYPNVQFLFIGDGPLRPACEKLINELSLEEKFFLLGYREDVSRILPILTIAALSSLWEGLPIVFLEALGAGKPIVANDVDGAKEVVINGETGFLVTPHQPSEMAKRILHLLNNEKLCKDMGDIAKQRSAFYSVERMIIDIEFLYKELLYDAQRSVEA